MVSVTKRIKSPNKLGNYNHVKIYFFLDFGNWIEYSSFEFDL